MTGTNDIEGQSIMTIFSKDTSGQDNVLDGTVYAYESVPGEGAYITVAGRDDQVHIVAFDLTDLTYVAKAAQAAATTAVNRDGDLTQITERGIGPIVDMLSGMVTGPDDDTDDDSGAEPGDLVFYTEPATVGRFGVGLGEVTGEEGVSRVGLFGPLETGDHVSAFYLTIDEAKTLGAHLSEVAAAAEKPW